MGTSHEVLPKGRRPPPGDGGSSLLPGPAGPRTQGRRGGHAGAVFEGEWSLLRIFEMGIGAIM